MDDDSYDQLRALCTSHLACGHEIDKKKTEVKVEFKLGSDGAGYYALVKFFCKKGHYTDWIERKIGLPGQFETMNHKRELR